MYIIYCLKNDFFFEKCGAINGNIARVTDQVYLIISYYN